jgi:hypothetical protein
MNEYIKIVIYSCEDIGDGTTACITVPEIITYALQHGESLTATVKSLIEIIKNELDKCGGVYE